MAIDQQWLSAAETFSILSKAGLRDAELMGVLSRRCAWGERIRTTGFRRISLHDGTAKSDERSSDGIGHLWRYFCAPFADVGLQTTIIEADWIYWNFKYRIERDAHDDSQTCEVACWINWRDSRASYTVQESACENEIQEVWDSVRFDRHGVEALARDCKRNISAGVISVKETHVWIAKFSGSNSKSAWKSYKDEFGARAISQSAFTSCWKDATGNRGRGRIKARST